MRAALICFAIAAFGFVIPAKARVVIDTRHNEVSRGPEAANGEREFAFNRRFSAELVHNLRGWGVEVEDIHSKGSDRGQADRMSRSTGAQLFVSIAHGQGLEGEGRGFAVLIAPSSIHAGLNRGSAACAVAIADGMLVQGEVPSTHVPKSGEYEWRAVLDETRGIQRINDMFLRRMHSPAVILEVGVVSNQQEAARLASTEVVQKLASQVARSILGCLG